MRKNEFNMKKNRRIDAGLAVWGLLLMLLASTVYPGDAFATQDPSAPGGLSGVAQEGNAPEDAVPENPEDAWKEGFYPVPATPPVDLSYFSDALFIGDSRVVGLMLYSGLTETAFYAEKGLNVNTLLSNRLVLLTGGNKITIPEALRKQSFGKIYIKIGLNELGWRNISLFADAYGAAIDRIRELQPDAVIYVQSILPVSRKKSEDSSIFTNKRIMEFNEAIKKMTWEKDVHYLDVYGGMIDDQGNMPEAAGHDGVHLNKEYCLKWVEYLIRHTVRNYEEIRL